MPREVKVRKSSEGNYPFYSGVRNAHAEAYEIVTGESAKMVWNLIKKWRKKEFQKSVLNYTIRRVMSLATTHLEHEGLVFALSEGAQTLELQQGFLYKHQIIAEHPVPMKVIIQDMIENANSAEDCLRILKHWSRITIVTREEDALLNAQYQTKMPEDWDGKDVWARYRKVGIKVLCNDY
jgi:hypothetical protein